MKKALLIALLLLLITPALSEDNGSEIHGDENRTVLISAETENENGISNETEFHNETETENEDETEELESGSRLRERVHEAIQTMNTTHLRFNETEIDIEDDELFINMTREQRRMIISETELEIDDLELFNGSPIKAEIKTRIGEIEIKIIREQNKVHIENDGVETEIMLELNDRIRIENNQLILNASGTERVLTVLPAQAMNQLRATNLTITNMSLIQDNERSVYKISEKRKAKLIGLFEVELEVESRIDATNGELISSLRPWWSFLTTE